MEEQARYEDATREFQRAISINSKNSFYYDDLAFCLQKLERYDEAIEVLNQAISLDPKDSYAYRELGIMPSCSSRRQSKRSGKPFR